MKQYTYKGTFHVITNEWSKEFIYSDTVVSFFKWMAWRALKQRNTAQMIKMEKLC